MLFLKLFTHFVLFLFSECADDEELAAYFLKFFGQNTGGCIDLELICEFSVGNLEGLQNYNVVADFCPMSCGHCESIIEYFFSLFLLHKKKPRFEKI